MGQLSTQRPQFVQLDACSLMAVLRKPSVSSVSRFRAQAATHLPQPEQRVLSGAGMCCERSIRGPDPAVST